MKHANLISENSSNITNYDQFTSPIGQKVKGEVMHENGFEFEPNLKHYQRAVSLMTSLACSIRI